MFEFSIFSSYVTVYLLRFESVNANSGDEYLGLYGYKYLCKFMMYTISTDERYLRYTYVCSKEKAFFDSFIFLFITLLYFIYIITYAYSEELHKV